MPLHDALLAMLVSASVGYAIGCIVGVHGTEKRLRKSPANGKEGKT